MSLVIDFVTGRRRVDLVHPSDPLPPECLTNPNGSDTAHAVVRRFRAELKNLLALENASVARLEIERAERLYVAQFLSDRCRP